MGQLAQVVLSGRQQNRPIKTQGFTPFGSGFPADVQMEHFSTGSSIAEELYVSTMQQNEPPVLKKNS